MEMEHKKAGLHNNFVDISVGRQSAYISRRNNFKASEVMDKLREKLKERIRSQEQVIFNR